MSDEMGTTGQELKLSNFTLADIEPGDALESEFVIGADGVHRRVSTVLVKGGAALFQRLEKST